MPVIEPGSWLHADTRPDWSGIGSIGRLTVGGLSLALGFHARVGAIALLVFLVPVTLFMHKFWGISDAQQAHMQMINFMKNVALMGGALFFVYAGAGAYSLDARSHRTELITP